MSRYVYHGRHPGDGPRWDNSIAGVIEGESYPVYYMDIPEPEDSAEYRAHALENLPGELVRRREFPITGGFTRNLGAAAKFHQSMSQLGAVFIADPARLSEDLHDIQYDAEWVDKHPGIYARIDSIDDFEVHDPDEDRLIGAGYFRHGDETPIVNKWTERVRNRVDDFAYQDEAEMVAFTSRVDFSDALAGTVTLAHTSRAIGGSVQGALAEHDGFKFGYGRRDQQDVTKMSEEAMAKALQNLIATEEAGPDSVLTDHHVVLYDEDSNTHLKDHHERIDADWFILATDGDDVYRDPGEVPIHVGWS